ncbi:MAG: hypothetical protein AAGI01_17840, partial [Myxococcota bacterium]
QPPDGALRSALDRAIRSGAAGHVREIGYALMMAPTDASIRLLDSMLHLGEVGVQAAHGGLEHPDERVRLHAFDVLTRHGDLAIQGRVGQLIAGKCGALRRRALEFAATNHMTQFVPDMIRWASSPMFHKLAASERTTFFTALQRLDPAAAQSAIEAYERLHGSSRQSGV